MIKEFLFKSSNSNILVGIRTSAEEWNQAIIGFITDVNEESVILNEVDKNGLLVGNTTILLDDIISLDFAVVSVPCAVVSVLTSAVVSLLLSVSSQTRVLLLVVIKL
jgi:hypothetical protein